MRMKKISVFMVHLLTQIQKLSDTNFPKSKLSEAKQATHFTSYETQTVGQIVSKQPISHSEKLPCCPGGARGLVQKHVLAEKVKLIVVIAYLQRKDGVLTPVQMYFLKPLMRNALKTL